VRHELFDLGGLLGAASDVLPAPLQLDPRRGDPVPVARRLGRRERSPSEPLRLVEATLHERSHGVKPPHPRSIERLAEALRESGAGVDLVVDLLGLPELEEIDDAPAVALQRELELSCSALSADD